MTPRALFWLGKRYRQRRRREEYLTALICSTLVNYSAKKLDKVSVPADFMRLEIEPAPEVKRKSRKELAEVLRGAFGGLAGVSFIPGG